MSEAPKSCCPAGSESYLISSYVPTGEIITLAGGVQAYVSKTSHTSGKAVILLPDIYGWNGGHIRKIADMLSADGYYTIVPKILNPCMDGSEEGDGVPPNFEMEGKMAELGAFMTSFPWPVLKPRVAQVIDHVRSLEITKVACLGFCWGGWMGAHSLTEEEWSDVLVCAASPHPSMHIEGWLHGTPNGELPSRVKKPMLLLPAGNDPDAYRPGGDIHDSLMTSSPSSLIIDTFKDMKHGWVVRGDMSDSQTAQDVTRALTHIKEFISKHLN